MANVRFAIKFATRKDTGVISTTTNVIDTFTDSMNPKVPTMVATPVKSWVNPISSPSANWSTSAITRLTISPLEWLSIYLSGRISILRNASFLMSRTTW